MALLTLNSLVLRNLRMGDTSRIVTVLSREQGKLSAIAKGSRDPKAKFGASLEILNQASLVVYLKPGRSLQFIGEGSLEREFRGILTNAIRYHHGCALLEFLDRTIEEDSPVPEIFDLSLRVLGLMEESPEGRLGYLLRAFQFRVAGWLGYAPRLDACARCGGEATPLFDVAHGVLLCGRCAAGGASVFPLDGDSLRLLRSVQSGTLPRNPGREDSMSFCRAVDAFLAYHLDRYAGLRSLRCLEETGRIEATSRAARERD